MKLRKCKLWKNLHKDPTPFNQYIWLFVGKQRWQKSLWFQLQFFLLPSPSDASLQTLVMKSVWSGGRADIEAGQASTSSTKFESLIFEAESASLWKNFATYLIWHFVFKPKSVANALTVFTSLQIQAPEHTWLPSLNQEVNLHGNDLQGESRQWGEDE